MKELFTINRGALLPALSAVNKSVERRSTIPILLNVLLSYEDGALIVTGTDLDAEIRTKVETSGLKAFDGFTLPSSLLHDAVRKLPDGADISFQADDKKDSDKVTVSAGRARFQLNSLPESDFPHMAAGTFTHNMTLPAKALGEAIGLVSFAISAEETRYYLNGIYLHIAGDNELALVATDGHRLALHKMPLPEDLATDMPGVIIPRKTIGLLQPHATGDGDVNIALSDGKIRFSFPNGIVVTSKLIDGTFPEYWRVIPKDNQNYFKIDIEPVAKAIDRVVTISNEKGNACKFQFEADHLALTVSNPDQGSAEDQTPIELIAGEPVTIGFNSKYCLEMFSVAGSKQALIYLGDAGSPALIHPSINGAPSESTSFVLMPMRV